MSESEKKVVVPPRLSGRRRIYASENEITPENVAGVLSNAYGEHTANIGQIKFLYDYYRGIQPILDRVKEVRPTICNRIVVNHAQECVSFKVGYQLSEPIQYVSRIGKDDDTYSAKIARLNDMMFAEDKASMDHDLFEWMCICGLGERLVLPDTASDTETGGAPFEIYTIDPRDAFVIYSPSFEHKPMAGVVISHSAEFVDTFTVYTPGRVYTVRDNLLVDMRDNVLGIPLIEYELNNARMGVFEAALPILDAINAVESNRLDGIEQTVQSLIKFINCDIDEATFAGMLALGAVKVKSVDGQKGDVDIIKNDLDQTQTQVTKDDLYQSFLNISGMPNRNVGSGASDTGAAVVLRDGWTLAESHAKSYELQFKKAERSFLRVVLRICSRSKETDIGLNIGEIDMAFNRRNYDNILTKSQVLTTMLAEGSIHPLLAYRACGLFVDPEAAYLMSEEWVEEHGERAPETVSEPQNVTSSAGQPQQ